MAEPPKFARVLEIQALTASVSQILLEMIEPRTLEYRPGQTVIAYIGFKDGKEIKRQYTLASAPHEKDGKEILLCIKNIPGGPASEFFAKLKAGDQVTLGGPAGKCCLPEEVPGDLLFCCTGNGLAPIRGMLLTYFRKPRASTFFERLLGKVPKVRLLWGLASEEDIFWQKELLEPLAKEHPSFRYEITLSQGGPAWQGRRGRVSDAALTIAKGLKAPTIFLIGNGAMIKDVRKRLEEEAKIPRDSILTEAFFTPKGAA